MKYPIASKRQVCNTKKNWYLTSELVSVTSVVPMRGVRKKVFAWRITKCLDLENAIQAKRKQTNSNEVIKLSPATVHPLIPDETENLLKRMTHDNIVANLHP